MAAPWSFVLLVFLAVSASAGTFSDFRATTVNPGFPRNASTNDPEVKKAARITVYAFNNMSNDIYFSKELEIQKAMIQVVKGIKYMLSLKLARTVCRKNTEYILDDCDFQKEPLKTDVM
ncbi:cystatin-F isoform X2 [Dendropsophus ebraccatus]|uniref:cystatin-F isoform X2 n=1 Tax=Dendropsophus ebraccatus TaxID=150705 RepID=UPI003831676A